MLSIGIGISLTGMRSGSAGFNPASLFVAGEPGDAWVPYRDWCYTKSAGGAYERVTTTGDAIARITGMVKGINADQDTEAARPIYNEGGGLSWASFNGTSQTLRTPSIDFTNSDEMFVAAGIRKQSDAALGFVAEISASSTANTGAFGLWASTAPGYVFRNKGTSSADASASNLPSPHSAVLTGRGDISADVSTLRVNGAQVGTSGADQGTGNYGNHPLYIGARGGSSLFLNGRIYSLIVRGKLPAADELAAAEKWAADKTGVALA